MHRKSFLSPCGDYRFSLECKISLKRKKILFIGLNPSKANDFRDDPTLRRLVNFSNSWGYGTLVIVNLFSVISSSPSIIKNCSDPIGKSNDDEIKNRLLEWSKSTEWNLWMGWGDKGVWQGRDLAINRLIKNYYFKRYEKFPNSCGPLVIGLTKAGNPRHPLYVQKVEKLKAFS
mgnify:CR=1 FL=1|tara:strand:- start:371 stop:892 length:522 start_codon:yes stop_codon:yes gene_type:complete